MQPLYFASFGVFLALMMKKNANNSEPSFSQQSVGSMKNRRQMIEHQENQELGGITPEKKKNKKKNKKPKEEKQQKQGKKNEGSEKMVQKIWKKQEQDKKINCRSIGLEVQSLKSYFNEELQTIVPYNGRRGQYKLSIPIPNTNYSEIPICIKVSENYPFELPEVNIETGNLHPIELQKLEQIVNEQKVQFVKHQSLFCQQQNQSIPQIQLFSNSLKTNKEKRDFLKIGLSKMKVNDGQKRQYLNNYYPYLFNLCSTISAELFMRVRKTENLMKPAQKNLDRNKSGSNEKKILKEQNKKQELKKEILANMLQEIFYDYEEENNKNNKSIASVKMQEVSKKQIPAQQNHNARGRYIADYEQLEKIGEGGFGRVYKCKNRVDSNIYAVKKMVINYNDAQSRKMLKEVALLSKLNHPNIVRYHQSWLEDTMSVDELIADMSVTEPEEIEEFNNIWKEFKKEHKNQEESSQLENQIEDEESVMFGDDIVFEENEFSDIVEFVDSRKSSKNQISQSESSEIPFSSSRKSSRTGNMHQLHHRNSAETHEFPFKILYLVMEYCGGMTLKDYIGRRFHEPNQLKIKLIRGILEGLSYIHSRRIIHRDLKPANIFLIEGTNKVKIGDFGLAIVGHIENNPYEAEIIEYSEKTKGVGTTFYRAPEQLKSSNYDEKIDIYSLGIIMLEMFYQFGTNMERYQILNEVTRTSKLPKDFNKNEQYVEHAQQIQSCISQKPHERPSVQKLLQAFRNKYFTQLVSVIANPKHFQFEQLVNHLFRIKNESGSVMKQILHRNYLTNEFIKIYQNHRGILFTPLSLVPVLDFQTLNKVKIPMSRKEKYLLLSERGVILEYPSNTFSTWIRYAKETFRRNKKGEAEMEMKEQKYSLNEDIRRFSFEKVCEYVGGNLKNQFSFKEKYVTAFDLTYSLDVGEKPEFLCQALKISQSMVGKFDLTQKNPYIYICHSLVFRVISICYKVNEGNLYKFLMSTTEEKFRALKNSAKLEEMQKFKIEMNIAKKIINLMQMEFENVEDLLRKIGDLEGKIVLHETMILDLSLRELETELIVFRIQENVKWKIMIPPGFCDGFYWAIGPIKGFTSTEEYLPGCDLCNIHIEAPVNSDANAYEADVSVWSNGDFLKKDILQIVNKCWDNNVTVKWYDQSIGEKDLSCHNNIILKKKLDRVYLMIRKNNIGNFGHGIGMMLDKKHSQQDRQGSFIPIESFNFEVLGSLSQNFSKKTSAIHH